MNIGEKERKENERVERKRDDEVWRSARWKERIREREGERSVRRSD